MAPDLVILPRVLIVSRRTVRKSKFVDFVGEYHLDLIVSNGAAPIIVPRVNGIHMLLESYAPIHGVLLREGEDIDPSLYDSESSRTFSPQELEEIKQSHSSDTTIDHEKDSIELSLAKLCLERNIPYLGICRGSQVLNVACGGTLYQDIEKELSKNRCTQDQRVVHMDYENYDGHRHDVKVVENTPLDCWFKDSLDDKMDIAVNIYHHQGVKKLAPRFVPMAFSPDGLIEGFYDPNCYNPEEGKFIVGLQFHPERMHREGSDDFDYPGCSTVYQEFVKAVKAYEKKINDSTCVPKALNHDQHLNKKRKFFARSFSLAKNMYSIEQGVLSCHDSEFEGRAEFLEANGVLSRQEENRLMQIGATVRRASAYKDSLKMNEEREKLVNVTIESMSVLQITDLASFYHKMGQICAEALVMKS